MFDCEHGVTHLHEPPCCCEDQTEPPEATEPDWDYLGRWYALIVDETEAPAWDDLLLDTRLAFAILMAAGVFPNVQRGMTKIQRIEHDARARMN